MGPPAFIEWYRLEGQLLEETIEPHLGFFSLFRFLRINTEAVGGGADCNSRGGCPPKTEKCLEKWGR